MMMIPFVCLFVCTLKGKWLELSTPKWVETWQTWHDLTLKRLECQRVRVRVGDRHGAACRYDCTFPSCIAYDPIGIED